MLMLPWIFKLNNYISVFFIRPPPLFEMFLFSITFQRKFYHGQLFKFFSGNDFPPWSY